MSLMPSVPVYITGLQIWLSPHLNWKANAIRRRSEAFAVAQGFRFLFQKVKNTKFLSSFHNCNFIYRNLWEKTTFDCSFGLTCLDLPQKFNSRKRFKVAETNFLALEKLSTCSKVFCDDKKSFTFAEFCISLVCAQGHLGHKVHRRHWQHLYVVLHSSYFVSGFNLKIQNSFLLSNITWIDVSLSDCRGGWGGRRKKEEIVWILLQSTSGLVKWMKNI